MNRPFRTLFASAVLPALVCASCGGDGGDGGGFLERANGICADALTELGAIEVASDSPEDRARAFGEAASILEDAVEDIRGIGIPADRRDEVEAFLADLERSGELAAEAGEASAAEDQAAIDRLSGEFDETSRRAETRAEEAGLDDCVSEGG